MYLCKGGNVCICLFVPASWAIINYQSSVACIQVHIVECRRCIRQFWPNTTGSNVEAHVCIHTDMLACSSLSEAMPHHPFCRTTIFLYLQRRQCWICAVSEFQGTSSHTLHVISLSATNALVIEALRVAVKCSRSRKRDQVDLWMT